MRMQVYGSPMLDAAWAALKGEHDASPLPTLLEHLRGAEVPLRMSGGGGGGGLGGGGFGGGGFGGGGGGRGKKKAAASAVAAFGGEALMLPPA